MNIELRTKSELTITTHLVQDDEHFDEVLLFGQPAPDGHELGEHQLIEHLRSVVVVPGKRDEETGVEIHDLHAITADEGVDHYASPEVKDVVEAAREFFAAARGIASNVYGRAHFVEAEKPIEHVTLILKPVE